MSSQPGLPDGFFSYQKPQFGYILDGLGVENVGIFWMVLEWKMLVYFMAVWHSLCSFGTVYPFWYVWNYKNLATLRHNEAQFRFVFFKTRWQKFSFPASKQPPGESFLYF
jgi:hypothetical protein